LIDVVYAMGAGGGAQAGAQAGLFQSLVPMILIFGIFYLLLIRPQQKKAKEHREMISSLKKGDRVITSGGLYARVMKADDPNAVSLEIADKVRVKCARGNISGLVVETASPGPVRADESKK